MTLVNTAQKAHSKNYPALLVLTRMPKGNTNVSFVLLDPTAASNTQSTHQLSPPRSLSVLSATCAQIQVCLRLLLVVLVFIRRPLDRPFALPVSQVTIAPCKRLKITRLILALTSSTALLVLQSLFSVLTVSIVRLLHPHLKQFILIALLAITVSLVFSTFATQDICA